MAQNTLYYGDNLDILRRYIQDESIDLIYLDPPFNSNATYTVLLGEQDDMPAVAPVKAFEDTWHWDSLAQQVYQEITEEGPEKVAQALRAFHLLLGEGNLLAYLAMMAPRLLAMRNVLKPTGSLYLHCDPSVSHYLKTLMDAVFGIDCFRSEIIWQRSMAKSHASTSYPVAYDSILYYSRSQEWVWNSQYLPYREEYIASHYANIEAQTGRRYTLDNCLNPNPNRPNLTYEWNGQVRVWRWTRERMQQLHESGRLIYTRSGLPRYKRYLDEMKGIPLTSVWTDILPINSQAAERLGYPTQKPVALLERIIKASSNEGDTVLDPFAGCGTAVVAAQKLGRNWIGIDNNHLAMTLVRHRLHDAFGPNLAYALVGGPDSLAEATALANTDILQFQFWALGLVGALPAAQMPEHEQQVSGRVYFNDQASGNSKQVLITAIPGAADEKIIRSLRNAVERRQAEIGALLLLEEPATELRQEVAAAGNYHSPGWNRYYPRLQILTIAELLAGKNIEYPSGIVFRRTQPQEQAESQQGRLF